MHQNGFDAINDQDGQYDEDARDLAATIEQCGRELSTHIDRISQSMTDFDPELTATCLRDFDEALRGVTSRAIAAYLELTDLYALDGDLFVDSDYQDWVDDPPGELDTSRWPTVPREGVRKGILAIVAQTSACTDRLEDWSLWIDEYLGAVGHWYDDEHPLVIAYRATANVLGVGGSVGEVVALWQDSVVRPHRKLAASQNGLHPPRFLAQEARMQAVRAEIEAKLGKGRNRAA